MDHRLAHTVAKEAAALAEGVVDLAGDLVDESSDVVSHLAESTGDLALAGAGASVGIVRRIGVGRLIAVLVVMVALGAFVRRRRGSSGSAHPTATTQGRTAASAS